MTNEFPDAENAKRSIKPSIRKFPSIYQFCNVDLNKFILLLRKGVYPYEGMDNCEKFDETAIPPKKAFYSKLSLKVLAMQIMSTPRKYGKYLK